MDSKFGDFQFAIHDRDGNFLTTEFGIRRDNQIQIYWIFIAEAKLKDIESDIASTKDSTHAQAESGHNLKNLVQLVDEGMASLAEKIATTNPELSSDFSNLNIQEKVKKMVDELHKVNFEN